MQLEIQGNIFCKRVAVVFSVGHKLTCLWTEQVHVVGIINFEVLEPWGQVPGASGSRNPMFLKPFYTLNASFQEKTYGF